jgi:hypothetical protein
MILNEEAQVSMAGKIHIGVKPLDPETPVDIAHVFNESGDVDLEKFKFDVLVTNDSGTFKPDGKYLPSFAQLIVDDLNIPQLSYKAWTPPGTPKIEGIVYRGGTR